MSKDYFDDGNLHEDYEYDLDAMYKEIGMTAPKRDPSEIPGISGDEYVLTLEGYVKLSSLVDKGTVTLYSGKRWDRFTITPVDAKSFCYVKMTNGIKMHVGTGQKLIETDGLVIKSKYITAGDMLSQVFKRPETPQDLNKLARQGEKGFIMANHYNNMRTQELGTGEIIPVLRTGLTIPMAVCIMIVNSPILLYQVAAEDREKTTLSVNGFVFMIEGDK